MLGTGFFAPPECISLVLPNEGVSRSRAVNISQYSLLIPVGAYLGVKEAEIPEEKPKLESLAVHPGS